MNFSQQSSFIRHFDHDIEREKALYLLVVSTNPKDLCLQFKGLQGKYFIVELSSSAMNS